MSNWKRINTKKKSGVVVTILMVTVAIIFLFYAINGISFVAKLLQQPSPQGQDTTYIRLNEDLILKDDYKTQYIPVYKQIGIYIYELLTDWTLSYTCDDGTKGNFLVEGVPTVINILGRQATVNYKSIVVC